MHSTMGWCKHGYINQMVKFASHRFQGIAGRSNTERMFSLFDIGLPGVTKKIGAAPRGLPLTLRNYI